MDIGGDPIDMRRLFRRLAALDPAAFGELATRLRAPLIAAARRRLRRQPELGSIYHPEDAFNSGLGRLWKGLAGGRIAPPPDRDKFLRVARTIIARRIIAQARKERASKRNHPPHPGPLWSVGPFFRLMPEDVDLCDLGLPSAEADVAAKDELRWLLGLLGGGLRELAEARLEGGTVAEIAARRGEPVRTVERRLAEVRQVWYAALMERADRDGS